VTPRVVGVVLVRNEDVFVERAIRNVVRFCDEIHAFDHVSRDETWRILQALGREFDHLQVRRARDAADSHRVLERYAGKATWVLGVDGDELYDPARLALFREQLLTGAHDDVFRLKGHVLNCVALHREAGTASGFMAPPSRPVTKLYNFGAVDAWSGSPERLHGGDVSFRPGFGWESVRSFAQTSTWEEDPLRFLHVCFVRRSTRDRANGGERANLAELHAHRRDPIGTLRRLLGRRAVSAELAEILARGGSWKRDKYMRGEQVTLDARPFLEPASTDQLTA